MEGEHALEEVSRGHIRSGGGGRCRLLGSEGTLERPSQLVHLQSVEGTRMRAGMCVWGGGRYRCPAEQFLAQAQGCPLTSPPSLSPSSPHLGLSRCPSQPLHADLHAADGPRDTAHRTLEHRLHPSVWAAQVKVGNADARFWCQPAPGVALCDFQLRSLEGRIVEAAAGEGGEERGR